MHDRLSRRTVLRGGGLAVAFPFLASLAPRPARAAGPAKRIVFWYQPDGVGHGGRDYFFPTGTETDFTLNRVTSRLEPIKDQLVFVRGVNNTSNPSTGNAAHYAHMRSCLTSGEGTSIDQIIADRIAAGTPFKSLELGVGADSGQSQGQIVFRGGKALSAGNNPNTWFMRLFAGQANPAAGQETLARLQRQRKSVLDGVREEIASLRATAGRDDRALLDGHATSLRELELRLDRLAQGGAAAAGACGTPRVDLAPVAGQTQFWGSWEYGPGASTPNYEKVAALQHEILTLAMKCDLTRVASVTYSRSNSGQRFPWLPLTNKETASHVFAHGWAGMKDGSTDFTLVMQWRCDIFRDLVERFRATPDPTGGGSLLDGAVIIWVSDYGNGDHSSKSIPYTLAGRAGGALKTGRYLQYGGEHHGKLLVSLAHLMGVPLDKLGAGTGPLAGLTG